VVRVISDDARSDLPPEVATLLTRSGSYRVGAALRAIWNRPSSLKDFWTLHERALEAADHLARFLTVCLDDLPR
jgi:adenosylhomocysteine nucleosidase